MARNRKRAKERRARRPQPVASARAERDEPPTPTRHAAPDVELAEAQLALGRPELVSGADAEPELASEADVEPELPGETGLEPEPELGAEEPEFEPDQEEPEPADAGGGRRAADGVVAGGSGEGAAAPHPVVRQRAGVRLVRFLQGSWRELQRVQWPDRRQVVQATGVVIGFVIVAGLYLGLADTVASRLVNFILK